MPPGGGPWRQSRSAGRRPSRPKTSACSARSPRHWGTCPGAGKPSGCWRSTSCRQKTSARPPAPGNAPPAQRHVASGSGRPALAQFATEKKRLQEAADYYEILRRDFNAVKVLDGKTGAEVYDDVISDKRLLPFLGNLPFPSGQDPGGDRRAHAFRDSAGFPLTRSGPTSPFWNRHELRLKLTGMQDLLLVDRAGKPLWSQATRDSLWSNRTLFLDRRRSA